MLVSQTNKQTNQIKWVNCAKSVAILAVLIDHTYNMLYTDAGVNMLSYFSVSLFIMISGILSWSSIERRNDGVLKTFFRSSKKVFLAYLFATFFVVVFTYHFFDLQTYINYVLGFNALGPYYYVLLYLQLMLASKPLYNLIKKIPQKFAIIGEIGLGVVLVFISYLTTNYSNIFGVYGGGGKVIGGTYLLLFYLGMIFSKHDIFANMSLKKSVVMSSVSLVLLIAWGRFYYIDRLTLDSKIPFGDGKNPPSITLIVWTLIILFFCCGFFSLMAQTKFLNVIVSTFSWLGKHTLYIFLFHLFWRDNVCVLFSLKMGLLKWVVYLVIMIGGSILLEYLTRFLKYIFFSSPSADVLENVRKY